MKDDKVIQKTPSGNLLLPKENSKSKFYRFNSSNPITRESLVTEWVHQMINNQKILSMIPVRNRDCLISRTRGRYRKKMRREFDYSLYHQRNKCKTIFSVIKRKFGSEIKSHHDTMKEKELLYRVLAYNCHRMTMISCLLWMISRKPIFHIQSLWFPNPYPRDLELIKKKSLE